MNSVRRRNESAWLLPLDGTRTNWDLRDSMRRYDENDEVDLVIVGAGAGGGTLAQRMARAGWKVVVLEAGPFWDPDRDWVSDEAGARDLYWIETRVIDGNNPVEMGSNNSGRGVGGSMVHYAGYTPRFHPSDFETKTRDGVGQDWPISYWDLKPYYEAIEQELPVAGQDWPWGDPHSYPQSPHPIGGNGDILMRGFLNAGIDVRVGPVAISNGRFGHRPHCIYRGFCLQGCKVNAKASPLITHIPDALKHGAEVRPASFATRVLVDASTNLATGVEYVDEMTGHVHRQRARHVAVAGYSIETPRLLLNSATDAHPDGLGNGHDLLGRYLMVQGAPQIAGRFDEEIRSYKAPPPSISSEAFYETQPDKPYKRGFSLQTVSPLPIQWAKHWTGRGMWGRPLRENATDFVHWATMGALCEFLPLPDNRVTLDEEKDRRGIPVARFTYSRCENDEKLMGAATKVITEIMNAAGGSNVMTSDRVAHLVGGARMGADATQGVVGPDHRMFDCPNVLIVDGSVLPTQGSANPALTIMALAARCADLLVAGGRSGARVPETSRTTSSVGAA
ncbi:MAG: GMC family oxidoreductase [Actinomycetes bacterium]